MVTQVSYARKGIATKEVKAVAKDEGVPIEVLLQRVANGIVVIPRNFKHEGVRPLGIGEGLRVKVNANIGTSPEFCDPKLEVEKAKAAVRYGADTVMDLSTAGDLDEVRRSIIEAVNVPVGTVPIYQAAVEAARRRGAIVDMDEDDVFKVIKKHADDGVDFMTVHCGVTKSIVERLAKKPRLTGIVSRGGTFLAAWIIHNDRENPLYANYDYLLELAYEYDFSLSLGDGLRPGCLADATDSFQIDELLVLGELVDRARRTGVQVMVEGPGHLPLNQVKANVQLEKAICKDSPFYVLGPIPTDIAPGYDHIVGAVGGALAGVEGADFLCYLTPAEHLGLPSLEDVVEGVIATRIAAHICDIVKLGSKASRIDFEMAKARASLDWEAQYKLSINPEKARRIHERVKSPSGACTMCGSWCVFKILQKYAKGPEAIPKSCL